MWWLFRKRKTARFSEIVEGALSALLKETCDRLMQVYLPVLGDDLGELFAAHYTSFVLVLTRCVLFDEIAAGRFRGNRLSADELEQGWGEGLTQAIRHRSRTGEAYDETLRQYREALIEYDRAIAEAAGKDFPASRCFLVTSRFADRIVELQAGERHAVMEIAASLADMIVDACRRAPRYWSLTGP